MKPQLDKERNERYREIAAMPRQDLNAHAWLCEQEQEEYAQEVLTLKSQVEAMQKAMELVRDTLEHKKHDDRTSWNLWFIADQTLQQVKGDT